MMTSVTAHANNNTRRLRSSSTFVLDGFIVTMVEALDLLFIVRESQTQKWKGPWAFAFLSVRTVASMVDGY